MHIKYNITSCTPDTKFICINKCVLRRNEKKNVNKFELKTKEKENIEYGKKVTGKQKLNTELFASC